MSTPDPSRLGEPEWVSARGSIVAMPTSPLGQERRRPSVDAGWVDARGPDDGHRYIGVDIDSRYSVEALVGTGGMGLVYRARHRAIDKTVAIKIMRADLAKDREAASRFANEARAASAVGSPHIVNVTDFGVVPDGSTYFVMEYLEGLTLADVLEKTGPLPQRRLFAIAMQIAEGLGDAHEAGIIHRDLKPENVFLVRHKGTDFVKILDFGIAKIAHSKNRVTRTGQIFGTPHYMSPEQARGLPVDHRSDLYSLGAILYEMVTGRVPFDGENPMVVLSQHVHEPPVPPSWLVPAPSRSTALDAVILKCLAKDPRRRYGAMADLIEDLRAVASGNRPLVVGHEPSGVPAAGYLDALDEALPVARAKSPPRRAPATIRYSRWAVGLFAGVALCWAAIRLVQIPAAVMRPLFVYGATRVAAVLYRASPQIEPGFSFALAGVTRPVALLLSPIDAEVFENGRSLGTMPLTLQVPVGQKVNVVVKRDGYWSRAVLVDDTQARRTVRLNPILGASSAPVAPTLEEPGVEAPNSLAAQGSPETLLSGEQPASEPAAACSASPPVSSAPAESSSAFSTADGDDVPRTSSMPPGAPPSPAPASQGEGAAMVSAPDSEDEAPVAAPAAPSSEPDPAEADASPSTPEASSAPSEGESDAEPSDPVRTEPGSGPPTPAETRAPTDSGE
jgi:tRNA A-37 threonylcarbamoyl transferase component Bud32